MVNIIDLYHMHYFIVVLLISKSVISSSEQSKYYLSREYDRIKNLLSLVEQYKVSMATYSPPQSNDQYKPTSSEVKDFGNYDFIVVGAGSSGATLASRLTEEDSFNVLLIETGGEEEELMQIPAAFKFGKETSLDWGYHTVPQKHACLRFPGQKCKVPCGKSLGGSSVINSMVYMRGNRHDYDRWAALGNPGWGHRDVLPYFRKSEQTTLEVDYNYRGRFGPLTIERDEEHWIQTTILKAGAEAGMQYNADVNGATQFGMSLFQTITRHHRRLSTNDAFLKSVRAHRPNLTVLTGAFATRVLLNTTKVSQTGPKAVGVEFTLNGQLHRAYSGKEVVLSAGAVNTPQLLMLSGIGPRAHLEEMSIKVQVDLPVGEHLSDHPVLQIMIETNLTDSHKSLEDNIQLFLLGMGNYARLARPVVNFVQFNFTHEPYPDGEVFVDQNDNNHLNNYVRGQVSSEAGARPLKLELYSMLLHPASEGTVRLASGDPFAFPLIDTNMLADQRDVDTMVDIVLFGIKLFQTTAMRSINSTFQLDEATKASCGDPGDMYDSREFWACYLHQWCDAKHHVMGTCRMAPKISGGVVSPQLQVYGVRGLMVADASVIPATISGHLHAATIMIGEKAADIIKKIYR